MDPSIEAQNRLCDLVAAVLATRADIQSHLVKRGVRLETVDLDGSALTIVGRLIDSLVRRGQFGRLVDFLKLDDLEGAHEREIYVALRQLLEAKNAHSWLPPPPDQPAIDAVPELPLRQHPIAGPAPPPRAPGSTPRDPQDPLLVVASRAGTDSSFGTGWLLERRVLVTALHVVGNLAGTPDKLAGFWQTKHPVYKYRALQPGHPGEVELRPLAHDDKSDIALLTADTDLPGTILQPASEPLTPGIQWRAFGFPGALPIENLRVEGLTGHVTAIFPGRLQLWSMHGTNIKGVSGAAMLVNGAVAGMIRAERDDIQSVNAAPVELITRLRATLPRP